MKQVKQIIEFILVLASCFFRKRKQQKVHPHVPEDPYPPNPDAGGKGDSLSCSGYNCNPQSEATTGHSGASGQPGNPGQRNRPPVIPNEGSDGTTPATGATTLLGWCLIAVAGTGTSYLYKLLV